MKGLRILPGRKAVCREVGSRAIREDRPNRRPRRCRRRGVGDRCYASNAGNASATDRRPRRISPENLHTAVTFVPRFARFARCLAARLPINGRAILPAIILASLLGTAPGAFILLWQSRLAGDFVRCSGADLIHRRRYQPNAAPLPANQVRPGRSTCLPRSLAGLRHRYRTEVLRWLRPAATRPLALRTIAQKSRRRAQTNCVPLKRALSPCPSSSP